MYSRKRRCDGAAAHHPGAWRVQTRPAGVGTELREDRGGAGATFLRCDRDRPRRDGERHRLPARRARAARPRAGAPHPGARPGLQPRAIADHPAGVLRGSRLRPAPLARLRTLAADRGGDGPRSPGRDRRADDRCAGEPRRRGGDPQRGGVGVGARRSGRRDDPPPLPAVRAAAGRDRPLRGVGRIRPPGGRRGRPPRPCGDARRGVALRGAGDGVGGTARAARGCA